MRTIAFIFFLTSAVASAKTATEVVADVESKLAPKNYVALNQFTNTRTDGTVNTYLVRFQVRDTDSAHGTFEKPEREKGREILRQGDSLWTYMPSVGRAVHVADRDSFAGGDFSNADVLRVDWLRQYKAEMVKETPKQWIVDLVAKGSEAAYSKMRLWVDKATVQPVQQQFYDGKGTLLKRCLYGGVKDFGKVTRPSRLRMENIITGQKSELEILDMDFDKKIPDSRFTVDRLGK